MKIRLLLLFAFVFSSLFAQIPTNGLQRAYDFTNGSLNDNANSATFIQNGSNLIIDNDRFSTSSNSIALNGDYLNSATFSFTDISIAFWIKTNIIDGNERTIFDKSERTSADFSSANDFKNGFFIYLKDGRIGFKSSRRVVANNNTQAQGNFLGDRFFSEFVADGTWKHIVITIKKEPTQFNTSPGRNTYPYTYNYYVDNELSQTSIENVNVGGIFTGRDLDRPVDLKVANTSNGMLTATQIYQDNIDDIYIYNRVLTASEVSQITTVNNYTVCITPDISNFSTTNITENTATLVLPQTDTFDVAYGLSSQPFNTYTIISDVNGNVFINNLDFSSEYTVQYRKKCSGNTTYNPTSGWSLPDTFRTEGPLFVNVNATGLNDGSSWINAYTSLQDALNMVNAGEEIWVASGIYKASTTDRTQSFTINNDDVKLYGGFAGTETSLSQRDILNNETILSGDLLSNDNAVIEFTESTRSDNTQHIIRLNAQNTTIDGFTISDGHTMGASNESGAAIYVAVLNPLGFNVNNCIIKNNVADNGAFFTFSSLGAYLNGTRNVNVTNTVVENNLSRIGTIYLRDANAEDTNATLYNCLFKDNVVKDRTGGPAGFAGSVVWAVSNSVPARLTIALSVINCTAVNNQDLGTNGGLNNFTRSPIVFGENGSTMITDIANTIVWNNTTTGGNTSRAVSVGNNTNTGTVLISDSISNDDFANIASGSKVNTSNADPLFTSATDFTLQTTSPAKDFGNNSKLPIPLNVDLAGNSRIFNVAVDMGAYEFGATTFRPVLNILATDGSVTTNPNPTNGAYDFLETVSLMPVPNTGFEFTGWSGALSGNAVNEQLLMDSSKALTATFAPIQRTLTINSIGGTFITNPNPVNGTYDNGTVVTITITPNAGFMFDGWSGDATGNTNPLTITMDGDKEITANYLKNIVYVDLDATGANDGTSWTDAYTSLQNALDNNPISDFWVKAGRYVPGTTRGAVFTLMADQSLYGGFNGTETMLSQRDPKINVTILSGDINGNDTTNIDFANTTRNDNAYNIVSISGSNAVLDGVTVTGGNANGSSTTLREGAGIRVNGSGLSGVEITNCVIEGNISLRGGAALFSETTGSGNEISLERTLIRDNLAEFAPIFYNVQNSGNLDIIFSNCLMVDNVCARANGTAASDVAGIWIRTQNSGSTITTIVNSTIADNTSVNSPASSIMISASRTQSGVGTINLQNSIFYNNQGDNNVEFTPVGNNLGSSQTRTFNNSMSAIGFTGGSGSGNIIGNPLFIDSSMGDYKLQSTSQAVDAGNNTYVSANSIFDFNGNARIVNTTVDIGAFEFDASLSSNDFEEQIIDVKLYPNPTSNILNIKGNNQQIQQIEIYDMLGKQILKSNLSEISVSHLKSGIYILKAKTTFGEVVKRFIKQ